MCVYMHVNIYKNIHLSLTYTQNIPINIYTKYKNKKFEVKK